VTKGGVFDAWSQSLNKKSQQEGAEAREEPLGEVVALLQTPSPQVPWGLCAQCPEEMLATPSPLQTVPFLLKSDRISVACNVRLHMRWPAHLATSSPPNSTVSIKFSFPATADM
jgi:hypothetical protein